MYVPHRIGWPRAEDVNERERHQTGSARKRRKRIRGGGEGRNESEDVHTIEQLIWKEREQPLRLSNLK